MVEKEEESREKMGGGAAGLAVALKPPPHGQWGRGEREGKREGGAGGSVDRGNCQLGKCRYIRGRCQLVP